MRNIAIPFCISLFLVLGSFHNAGLTKYKIRKVVIDAGHGGKDPGTHGAISKEKDIALNISKELGRIINENIPDVEVVFTRKDDSFPTLESRPELANKVGADLFISIHANWVGNPNIHGTETYVMGVQNSGRNFEVAKRENSVILLEENYEARYDGFDPTSPESYILFSLTQSAYQERSLQLASMIEDQFKNRVGRRSRGVKQSSLWVLWNSAMPSVLVEVGYLSNPKEEKELNDELNQVYIASGIFRAFRDYKEEIESMN
ncbi:MAG: N-acetylmuramoyl-L-alanine amidase [Cyclobacteriaceae bacterium]